jgi:uncharacterized membrane protein YeiH
MLYGLEVQLQAVVLGAITGIGGGMLRDILVNEVPSVLQGGLYAVPALLGASRGAGATAESAGRSADPTDSGR